MAQFSPGTSGNPSGRPPGQRAGAVERYLSKTRELVTEEVWGRIVQRAIDDSLSDKFVHRQSGRHFLSKIIIPADPVAYMQIFAPQISLDDIRVRLAQFKELREEMVTSLKTIDVIPVEKVVESGESGQSS